MSRSSLLTLALALVVSLAACKDAAVQPEQPSRSGSKVELKLPVSPIRIETLCERMTLPGVVVALPDQSVKVSPGVAGKLIDIKVGPGDSVKKGQVIALLDKRQATNLTSQSHAKVLLAQASLAQAKTNLVLAQNVADRTAKLMQQEIAAEKDLVAAKSQVETAGAQVVAAQAQVDDAKAAEAASKVLLTYTEIKSPIAGVVAQRFLNISDSVDTAMPIVQIVNLSQVIVDASLPTSQPARIRTGQTASITAPSLNGKSIGGKVESLTPVTDNQGTTSSIRILCENSDYLLKEGMPVTVSILMAVHPHVLTVPISALVSDPSEPAQQMVYVYENGKVRRVHVQVGIQQDSRLEVLSGLNSGQFIVTSGAYGIPDGTEVEALSEALHTDSKVSSKSN